MIGIGTAPLPVETMRAAKGLNPQGGGVYTTSNLDNSVMCVTPEGEVQTRPAGTSGPWERHTVSGNVVYYCPDGEHVYPFAYAPSLP